jgi:murein L,D-transpeptidase YafK
VECAWRYPFQVLTARLAMIDTMKRPILIAVTFIGALSMGLAVPFLDAPETPLPDHVTADSVIVDKSMHLLSLFKDGQLLRTYRVSLGRGGGEPKAREGDGRTPEGTYFVDGRNPHSCCHLALHISYPSATDVAEARARGANAGSDIEIHGLRNGLGWLGRWHRIMDWTNGCIAVTDSEMDEIWRVVPNRTPIVIRH